MGKLGEYIELNATNLDRGRFLQQLNDELAGAFKKLTDYQAETNDHKKPAVVTVKITLTCDDDNFAVIGYETSQKIAAGLEGFTVICGQDQYETPTVGAKTQAR